MSKMWSLTAGLLLFWIVLVCLLVALAPTPGTSERPTPAWFAVWGGLLLLIPVLAGAVATGWRESSHAGHGTRVLAAAAGVGGVWAFFLALAAWESVNLPGQDLVSGNVDWDVLIAVTFGGLVLGIAGEGVWRVIAPRLLRR